MNFCGSNEPRGPDASPREARNTPLTRRELLYLPGVRPTKVIPLSSSDAGYRVRPRARFVKAVRRVGWRRTARLEEPKSTAQPTAQSTAPCPPHCGSAFAPPRLPSPAGISSRFCCRKMSEIPIYAGGRQIFRARTSLFARLARFILFRLTAEMIESLLQAWHASNRKVITAARHDANASAKRATRPVDGKCWRISTGSLGPIPRPILCSRACAVHSISAVSRNS